MKKRIVTLFVSLLTIVAGFSQSLTVATVNGTTGQLANVSVTASGIDEANGGTPIIGFQVNVTYQTSVVSYLQISNLDATLSANGTWTTSTANGGTIVALWEATDLGVPLSVPDGTALFDMTFNANGGGTSALSLINIEVIGLAGLLSPTLTDGSVTFGAPAATTTWTGTGVWYTPANWSNGLPGIATDAVISSGVITIDAAAAYTKNLTIMQGAGLTLNTGKVLSVNGNLVLESNATATATGSFLISGTYSVSGTTTVKRYLVDDVQHFLSIPVTAASISNFIYPSNTGYMHKWVESANAGVGAWENLWNPATQLSLATGYVVNYVNPQTVSITGALNNDAAYAPSLTRTGTNGWNFVGNPYACPLDWTIASGWTKTNLENAIYIWNNNVYAAFVGGVGTNGGSKYIPQFQGFFVHASAASPAISIKKAARTQNGNGTNHMKSADANIFRLSVSNGSYSDETVVYMSENASAAFDGEYDAYKLFGFNETAPHIYTNANDVDYAINAQPVADSLSLSLNLKAGQSGVHTINASGFDSFGSDYRFLIKDNETGMIYDLKQNNTITLTLSQGEIVGRFTLSILKSSLGIDDLKLQGVRVYADNNRVYIENCPESEVQVFSVTGAVVANRHFGKAYLNSMALNVPSGIYIVQVVAQNGTISSKLFIK
ncbi:MAG: T9SS type A sorting domain-containing protein [Bacteroidales bacterium]|nr:T9SS type A sorting domain-containing protein [Bacteroidales bacterium]